MKENLISLLNKEEVKKVRFVELEKGEILFHENDDCDDIGVVMSGEISISSYSYHGQEIIYNLLREDDVFGNSLIFSSDPHYKGNILAKKTAKVALISRISLLSIFQTNTEFLHKYLQIQSDFGKHLNGVIKLLSFTNAEERFLYYLFVNHNVISFKSVTALSQTLFLQRETVSRLLSKLEKEKRITRKSHQIFLLK